MADVKLSASAGSGTQPSHSDEVGVDCGEGPPVPIPNTEVKLISADNTWWVTAWEDRYCQHEYSSLAQLVEQLTLNQWVPGSSP